MNKLQRRRINKIYTVIGRVVAWPVILYLVYSLIKLNYIIVESTIRGFCELIVWMANTL